MNSTASGGNLLPGSTVKLLYDPTDPTKKFPNNTGIGFFLIPNGWNGGSKNVSNWGERIHSDDVFNTNNSRQVIALSNLQDSTQTEGKMIISFEDIMLPGGDKDYNDVVLQVTFNPSYVDTSNNLVLTPAGTITSDDVIIDNTGMYFKFKDATVNSIYNSTNKTFKCTHRMNVSNKDRYSRIKQILEALIYTHPEGTSRVYDDEKQTIDIILNLPKEQIQKYIYCFSSFTNRQVPAPYNPKLSALLVFQTEYVNYGKSDNGSNEGSNNESDDRSKNTITQSYKIETETENNDGSKTTSSYSEKSAYTPVVRTTTPLAMGDPHITTIYGVKYMIPNVLGEVLLYDDKEINITTELHYYPKNANYKMYKDLTFMKDLKVKFGDDEFVFDMFDMKATRDNSKFKVIEATEKNNLFKENYAKYKKFTKGKPFVLKYIQFQTSQLGNVNLEILFCETWRDLINQISILSPALSMVNAKGALIQPCKIVKKLNK